MFKFPWRNGFAVGITSGVCLATVAILFGQAIYDWARCNQNAECYRHAAKYKGEDFPSSWWWRWTGDLVSSSDTLAQWIMAIFTIAVVLLVWRTLIATQEMVRDTRDIGQKQARAYLSLEFVGTEIVPVETDDGMKMRVTFQCNLVNNGSTPAFLPQVLYDISSRPVGVERIMSADGVGFHDAGAVGQVIPAGGSVNHTIKHTFAIDVEAHKAKRNFYCISYIIKYRDVFNESIVTPLVSGHVVGHPTEPESLIIVFNRFREIREGDQ